MMVVVVKYDNGGTEESKDDWTLGDRTALVHPAANGWRRQTEKGSCHASRSGGCFCSIAAGEERRKLVFFFWKIDFWSAAAESCKSYCFSGTTARPVIIYCTCNCVVKALSMILTCASLQKHNFCWLHSILHHVLKSATTVLPLLSKIASSALHTFQRVFELMKKKVTDERNFGNCEEFREWIDIPDRRMIAVIKFVFLNVSTFHCQSRLLGRIGYFQDSKRIIVS